MAGKKDIFANMNLTNNSYLLDTEEIASDFSVQQGNSESETKLSVDLLVSFKNHPFKVNTEDEAFQELVESILENGIIYPILVRPMGDMYEIIAGHRRLAAGIKAGLREVPVIIKHLTDYEATVIMVDSNLHRPEILISEKVKGYRMVRDAQKHQGIKGNDTASKIGEKYKDSRRQVYRYIKLSYLIDEFLNKIDMKKMSMNIGLEIASLSENVQTILADFMEEYKINISILQAENLVKKYKKNNNILTVADLQAELIALPKKKVNNRVSFKRAQLQEYFEPDTDEETISNVILQLLQKYKEGLLDEYLE